MNKAISLKKFSHSRNTQNDGIRNNNNTNANTNAAYQYTHQRMSSAGSISSYGVKRAPSHSNNPPISANNNNNMTSAHKRNSSVNSVSSNLLAEQYDRDRNSIISSCFNKKLDPKTGQPILTYFTHVRIIEDSKYPSSRPAPNSSLTNKKKRVLIVSANNQTNQVFLNKARENHDHTFQIGRTWSLKELTCLESDPMVPEGFIFTMAKKYYWETNTAKERTIFTKTLVKIYMDYFEGRVPILINWDLSMFYLDERSYERAVIHPNESIQTKPRLNNGMKQQRHPLEQEQFKGQQMQQEKLRQQEEQLRKQQEDRLRQQQEEQLRKQQEDRLRQQQQQQEQLRKQQEDRLRQQQQQQEQLRKQQEDRLRQQQQEQEQLRKQQEDRLRQQQEDRLRQQQEEQLRKQQEDRLRQQQEEQLRKQQEEQLRKQQEEQSRKQQQPPPRQQPYRHVQTSQHSISSSNTMNSPSGSQNPVVSPKNVLDRSASVTSTGSFVFTDQQQHRSSFSSSSHPYSNISRQSTQRINGSNNNLAGIVNTTVSSGNILQNTPYRTVGGRIPSDLATADDSPHQRSATHTDTGEKASSLSPKLLNTNHSQQHHPYAFLPSRQPSIISSSPSFRRLPSADSTRLTVDVNTQHSEKSREGDHQLQSPGLKFKNNADTSVLKAESPLATSFMNETNSFTQSSPSYRDKDFTSRGLQDSQQPHPTHTVLETSMVPETNTAPETITIDSAHSAADTDIDLNDSINDSNNAELVVEEPIQPLNVFGHGQTQANDDSKISLDETNQAISKLPTTLVKKQHDAPDNFLEDLNLALSPTSPTASSALKNIGLHSHSESRVSQSSGGEKKGEKESNVDLSSGASDIDLNNTIDDSADLSFEKGDEVRYSQNFENISPTKFHEVSTIQEEDTKYGDNNKYSDPNKNLETSAPIIEETGNIVPVITSGEPRKPVSRKKRLRGFSVTSTTPENEKKAELQHVANILEQINWDADDTVDSLLLKLNGKMTDIEYRFNKELSAVSDTTSKLSSTKIKNACDQIDPWLSFFSMELSSFSKDIEIVESADNGLQVESANKKKLWNDLSQILNDVSIDQKTLDELSQLPISERNLGQLEKSLLKLYTALNAICGNDFSQKGVTDEDSYDLSKMRALRERRAVYESVTDAFVDRSVAELGKIFGSLGKSSLQISGILSRLLTYSSITLFVKYVSDDSFETIISEWNDNVAGAYEITINQILNNVVNNTIAPLGKDSQAITSFKDVGYLLKAWDEYKKTRNVDYLKAFKEDTCLKDIFKAISQVETLCLSYQNFIGKFFHMSSENIKIDEYIVNNPPSNRPQPLDKLAEIESDRKVAGDKYQMVSCVFQNGLAKFFNGLSNAIRKKHQILAPSLMMYVENEITKNLQKSDQEFLLSHFNRFFEKLQHDWDDYVLEQQLSMDRANLNYNSKSISPSFVGFSLFVFDLQQQSKYFIKEFDSNVQAQVTFQKLDTTYHKLGACVVSLLTKEDLSERLVDSLAPSADLNNGSSDGHTASSNSSSISMKKINKTVSLLINSHWLVETQNLLENEATTEIIATSAKQVFDSEKEKYADILVKTSMPKLYSFVQNAWTIVNTAGNANKKVDPSKWSTYSQNNLNKILDGYTSQEIHSLIDKLHKNMLQHFENQTGSTSDNGGLYKSMQQDLFTQLWSCVQGVTVSFYLRLYSLIDKHYKGTHVKFSKNDIISGFNEHKK